MSDAPEKTYTARTHAYVVREDGVEVNVNRRDDGRWYINPNNDEAPTFVSMSEAASLVRDAVEGKDGIEAWGVMRGLPGGEDFDAAIDEFDPLPGSQVIEGEIVTDAPPTKEERSQ